MTEEPEGLVIFGPRIRKWIDTSLPGARIIFLPGNRKLELLLDGVDTNDKLPGEASVVDTVVDNSIAGLHKRDHGEPVGVDKSMHVVADIPVEKTTVVAPLDGSREVEERSDRADRYHGDSKSGGRLVDHGAHLDGTLVVDGVGVSKILKSVKEGAELAVLGSISLIVSPEEDNSSLDLDADGGTDGLVGPLPDAHLRAEDLLKVGGLPGGWVHGLELADNSLGKSLNPEVDGEEEVLVAVHEGVGQSHTEADGSGALLGSNDVEESSVRVAILLLVELPDIGLRDTKAEVSLISGPLPQVLKVVLGELSGLLGAGVDVSSIPLEEGISIVDDLVVLVGVENGHDGGKGGSIGHGVHGHLEGGNPELVVEVPVSEDGKGVLGSLSRHESLPSGGPQSLGPIESKIMQLELFTIVQLSLPDSIIISSLSVDNGPELFN